MAYDYHQKVKELFKYSQFVELQCTCDPKLLDDLINSTDLLRSYHHRHYFTQLTKILDKTQNEFDLELQLRKFRHREMVRIAIRDLAGWATLDNTLTDVSQLACAIVDATLNRLYCWQCKESGTPYGEQSKKPQHLVVIGMGKLGGGELNFSSDIDLIFAFPENGKTKGRRPAITNEEFFTRLGRRLISAIDKNSANGFVFRVDMRLRPFGSSGALAMDFDALEEYYQNYGREWERYAWIRGSVIAGDKQFGQMLMDRLRPFIYRRYIDFGVFESLREMKQLIMREVKKKGKHDDVKLGSGGIREVEFLVQALQLVFGGSNKELQTRSTRKVLKKLAEHNKLPQQHCDELTAAYKFLRNTEHRLQEWKDRQTQALPKDDASKLRLANSMGFATAEEFFTELNFHRSIVSGHFAQLFSTSQGSEDDTESTDNASQYSSKLENYIQQLTESSNYQNLSTKGKQRFDQLLPLLLNACSNYPDKELVAQRSLNIIESIGRRGAYFALLVENPPALSQLIKLSAASPWISHHIAAHPALLDELLDHRILYSKVSKDTIANELQQKLSQIDEDDLERQMDLLRHQRNAVLLRIAAADIMGKLDLTVVGTLLSELAEVILDAALNIAYHHIKQRHGRPASLSAEQHSGIVVVGYGKLGGEELGYGSDLDIVMLHQDSNNEEFTDGKQPLPALQYYARVGQRLIHILESYTAAGRLYEVDSRLRPGGNSGALVTSITAFQEYQQQEAWNWEHQALVRARDIAGDKIVGGQFREARQQVLGKSRDDKWLKQEVIEMRDKMRGQLDRSTLKQCEGGIVDIEFFVQYLVLKWAKKYPQLLAFSDILRTLTTLGDLKIIKPITAIKQLQNNYFLYRQKMNRLALQEQKPSKETPYKKERQQVKAIIRKHLAFYK